MIDANNLHYERIKHMYMDTYQNKIIVERGCKKMKIIVYFCIQIDLIFYLLKN